LALAPIAKNQNIVFLYIKLYKTTSYRDSTSNRNKIKFIYTHKQDAIRTLQVNFVN